jgi:hypothetical protein
MKHAVLCFALASAAYSQQSRLAGPVLTRFVDPVKGEIVTLLGSPGSAVIGDPVRLVDGKVSGRDCPLHGVFAGWTEQGIARIWNYGDGDVFTPGVPPAPDSVVISPSATVVAFAYSARREVWLVRRDGSQPPAAYALSGASPVRPLAVSDDGAALVYAAQSDAGRGAWLWRREHTPALLRSSAEEMFATATPGGFVLADASSPVLFLCGASDAECRTWFDADAGFGRAAGVASDGQGRVAVAGTGGVLVLTADGRVEARVESPVMLPEIAFARHSLIRVAGAPDIVFIDLAWERPRIVGAVRRAAERSAP